MFYNDGYVTRSTVLELSGVVHAFSTRLGGVSTLDHTKSMNFAPNQGDSDETLVQNTHLFAKYLGGFNAEDTLCAHQIHSSRVRLVDRTNCGEGVLREAGEACDGFVTEAVGVVPFVRTADCVPIIMCATRGGTSPVAAVLHAGWRGTVADIVGRGVDMLLSLGAAREDIRAAIGPHIGFCCFEVGEDMRDTVKAARGTDFASRHIKELGSSLHADLTGMNLELLASAGVLPQNTDVSDECTFCLSEKYHSHRRTHGIRGAMAAAVALL